MNTFHAAFIPYLPHIGITKGAPCLTDLSQLCLERASSTCDDAVKVGLMQLAVDGQPLGPQDLRFDSEGMLWFTEVLPGKLGMFDPATGSLTELAVPVIAGKPPARYELAIDRRDSI